eukprot:TRINITY_DN11987_c0_g1_i1.p1 TRINITY_DN11987_c0_g1~~TRINITY_DN11987_c0_g1_i1.p1  ORF type:complete len:221 (+),score=26.23 TRINITY_DN11987_c0_g1_i1:125-787(+)
MEFEGRREVSTRLELLLIVIRDELSKGLRSFVEVKKIDPNYYRIILRSPPFSSLYAVIELKVLQVGEGVKLFGRLSDKLRLSISLNLNTLIKKITKNSYVLNESNEVEGAVSYFRPMQEESLRNILRYRIIAKITGEIQNSSRPLLLDMPEDIVGRIIIFLRPRDVLCYLTASSKLTIRYLNNNEFWYRLYNAQFRRTGFTTEQVIWKEAYFAKRRELKH